MFYIPCVGNEKIIVDDWFLAPIVEKGQISSFDGLSLHNVLHVLQISYNLLSISKIVHELYCKTTILLDSISFQDLSLGRMVGTTRYSRGLYLLDDGASFNSISRTSILSSYFTSSERDFILWHFCFGTRTINI